MKKIIYNIIKVLIFILYIRYSIMVFSYFDFFTLKNRSCIALIFLKISILTNKRMFSILLLRYGNMIEDIRCPICKKLIGKKETESKLNGIYFWCPRCKKNIEIKN